MKTFIGTPKYNSNNYLLNRLMDSYPELITTSKEEEEDYPNLSLIKMLFGAEYFKGKKADYRNVGYWPEEKKTTKLAKDIEFELALNKLCQWTKNKYGYKPLYDFTLADGTPVKEYQNFIQVGYNIIPKNDYRGFYNNFRSKSDLDALIIIIENTIINLN